MAGGEVADWPGVPGTGVPSGVGGGASAGDVGAGGVTSPGFAGVAGVRGVGVVNNERDIENIVQKPLYSRLCALGYARFAVVNWTGLLHQNPLVPDDQRQPQQGT